jgi:Sulfotransferase domain
MKAPLTGRMVELVKSSRTTVQRALHNPFSGRAARPLIVHWSHHKVGTVWFIKVLGAVSENYSLQFSTVGRGQSFNDADIVLSNGTRHFPPDQISYRAFKGSHMIRDPRDILVSAYFYHLRTNEPWVHEARRKWGGHSYQEFLRSLDARDGIFTEMERLSRFEFKDLSTWRYDNPDILELHYEDVLANEHAMMERIFRHYGFTDAAVRHSADIAARFSLNSSTTRLDPHVRSGRPGQWKEVLESEHVERFKELTGDLVVRLGYESTTDW